VEHRSDIAAYFESVVPRNSLVSATQHTRISPSCHRKLRSRCYRTKGGTPERPRHDPIWWL